MDPHFLSNRQILFTYYHLKSVYDRYQMTIQSQELIQHMMGDEDFKIKVKLPKTMVEELTNSKHYRTLVTLIESMTPIIELIEDVEVELAAEVKAMFTE